MILLNESWTAIGFSKVTASGLFDFHALDYGTYFLRAELPGVSCDNLKIDITTEKPQVEVYLNFSGNSILGLEETNPVNELISIYPNPVKDQLNILLQLPESSKVEIEIFTMSVQKIYKTFAWVSAGQNNVMIPFMGFPEGMYMIRITSEQGLNVVRKIIK